MYGLQIQASWNILFTNKNTRGINGETAAITQLYKKSG